MRCDTAYDRLTIEWGGLAIWGPALDSVEKAIRGAFEKGDPTDRAFRERVYRQVLAALDRALAANPSIPAETATRRREGLKSTIVSIEREFLPARPASPIIAAAEEDVPGEPPAPMPAAPAVEGEGRSEPPVHDAPTPGHEATRRTAPQPVPPVSAPPREEPRADMPPIGPASRGDDRFRAVRDDPGFLGGAFPDGPEPERAPAPDADASGSLDTADIRERARDRPPPRRRRGFAVAFIAATVLAALGIGIWWAGSTGLLRTAAERDTSVPNPPRELGSEDFAPDQAGDGESRQPSPLGGDTENRDWTTLFSPDDPTEIAAPSDALAEVAEDDGEAFLRLRTGESGDAVTFDIGRGVLERLAGRTAVFSISARAEGDGTTQMAVSCSLGRLGECGRKRYVVTQERADYLFELELPQGQPDTGGTISIVSDVEGDGRTVEIFDIRVAVQ
ncbi:MAG: hypothetical protein K5872_06380 [Rhizobiaceae bacterium]|nr:hypothetical protein [Rhizobiaceae bacterium]MCV0405840.1 hypothetical protein [Rhizobiaceae bacterium]